MKELEARADAAHAGDGAGTRISFDCVLWSYLSLTGSVCDCVQPGLGLSCSHPRRMLVVSLRWKSWKPALTPLLLATKQVRVYSLIVCLGRI
jgi:hypothetical protein